MKVTKKTLNRLHYPHYTVLGTETKRKTVVKSIPNYTGNTLMGIFPAYLKGYEQYYTEVSYGYTYRLKEEYKNHRPAYSIEITYKVYDIELTAEGKSWAEARYFQYKRLADEYSKLL